eukprot:CAMPEP_0172655420 /NCGR_PEP_ID=MMETSP1074-20121228/631_1 /TAXON_ID=2916 /ORGANISM="Ceratium fusus, Strain PA161109" /LENGTH=164 /DNA_ID=CAMNT_0013470039 /DNA_START=99 /DNA_END=593 /DNA_ORIENTATION=+
MLALAVANGVASPVANATRPKTVVATNATKPKAVPAPVSFNAKVNTHSQAAVAKPLKPIGEGAYQSSEAVAQRTLDKNRDCEKGKWNGCLHNDKADIVDGHSYGNLRGESASASAVEAPAPPPALPAVPAAPTLDGKNPVKSGAAVGFKGFAFAFAAVFLSVVA